MTCFIDVGDIATSRRHCPQARATAVADTPESRRLAENTRLQSQVKYHEDFEKQKGKVTQVADDPETLRIRNTSKIISNVAYHGELEKKKQMEEKRTLLPDEDVKNGFTALPQQIPVHPPANNFKLGIALLAICVGFVVLVAVTECDSLKNTIRSTLGLTFL